MDAAVSPEFRRDLGAPEAGLAARDRNEVTDAWAYLRVRHGRTPKPPLEGIAGLHQQKLLFEPAEVVEERVSAAGKQMEVRLPRAPGRRQQQAVSQARMLLQGDATVAR